jgi:hypothetical protein
LSRLLYRHGVHKPIGLLPCLLFGYRN